MITPDGWFDWAERVPGPPDKKYTEVNSATIFVPHSAVGYLNGWYSRLFSQERFPDGKYTPYAAASVHLWNAYNGHLIQHYPIFVSCWASGSRHLNVNGVAMENEGGFQPVNEPLREAQIDTLEQVLRDLAAFHGEPVSRWHRPTSPTDLRATLYEHNETTRFGGMYSSCPSGRIPWSEILRRLETGGEDDAMIRHNRTATWFNGRYYPPGSYTMGIRNDFGLPPNANYVRFGVDISRGHVRWFDGAGSGGFAGASSPRYSTIEVFLNGADTVDFLVEEEVQFNVVECLAYQ